MHRLLIYADHPVALLFQVADNFPPNVGIVPIFALRGDIDMAFRNWPAVVVKIVANA